MLSTFSFSVARSGTVTFRSSANPSIRTSLTRSTNIGRRRMKACYGNTLIFANVMMCRSGWASLERIPMSGIAQFVKALEKNNIGWAFWPYKKMEKPSAVVSIIPPADWGKIVEFAKLPRGTGHVEERLKVRPEQETITRAFAELLESVRLQKCRLNEGYLSALGMKSDIAPVSAGGSAN